MSAGTSHGDIGDRLAFAVFQALFMTMLADTLYAVIMLVMNGLVGVALLMGGLRHREQVYNLDGTGTYLALILPLSVIALVLPNYTHATRDPTFSLGQRVVVGTMTLVLYAILLAVQTVRHRDFFDSPDAAEAGHHRPHRSRRARSQPHHP
jgi:Ca2+:H+ antiporter